MTLAELLNRVKEDEKCEITFYKMGAAKNLLKKLSNDELNSQVTIIETNGCCMIYVITKPDYL